MIMGLFLIMLGVICAFWSFLNFFSDASHEVVERTMYTSGLLAVAFIGIGVLLM